MLRYIFRGSRVRFETFSTTLVTTILLQGPPPKQQQNNNNNNNDNSNHDNEPERSSSAPVPLARRSCARRMYSNAVVLVTVSVRIAGRRRRGAAAVGRRGARLARVRGPRAVRRGPVPAGAVRQVRRGEAGGGVRRGLRREPVVLVRVRRARPADRRLQEPAREPARGRGARLVQPGGPGRHQAHGGLHRGPAQRLQRGRHQGAAGQGVRGPRARLPRGQGVRRRARVRASGGQGVPGGRVPRARVPGVPLTGHVANARRRFRPAVGGSARTTRTHHAHDQDAPRADYAVRPYGSLPCSNTLSSNINITT